MTDDSKPAASEGLVSEDIGGWSTSLHSVTLTIQSFISSKELAKN